MAQAPIETLCVQTYDLKTGDRAIVVQPYTAQQALTIRNGSGHFEEGRDAEFNKLLNAGWEYLSWKHILKKNPTPERGGAPATWQIPYLFQRSTDPNLRTPGSSASIPSEAAIRMELAAEQQLLDHAAEQEQLEQELFEQDAQEEFLRGD